MQAAGSGLSEALSKHSGVEVALCGTGSGSSSYFTCIKPAPLMTPSLTGPPAQRATHLAQVSVPVNTAGSLPPGDLNSMVAARPAKALAPCPVTPLPTAGNSVMTGRPVAFPRHASTVPSPPQLHILSHLPTYGWQRCVVDFSAIQFVCGTDGSPQELGAGASATVSGGGSRGGQPGKLWRPLICCCLVAPSCQQAGAGSAQPATTVPPFPTLTDSRCPAPPPPPPPPGRCTACC